MVNQNPKISQPHIGGWRFTVLSRLFRVCSFSKSHDQRGTALRRSLIAYAIYQAARFFECKTTTAAKLACILGLLTLTHGWVTLVAMLFTLMALGFYRQLKCAMQLLVISAPIAIIIVGILAFARCIKCNHSKAAPMAWMEWNKQQIAIPNRETIIHFLNTNLVYMASMAVRGMGHLTFAQTRKDFWHISLALSLVACFTVLALINPTRRELISLPYYHRSPFWQHFGLPTMKRSAINAVDWFAVMIMTGAAGLFWLAWFAMQVGWPAKLSDRVLKWAPDLYQSSMPSHSSSRYSSPAV